MSFEVKDKHYNRLLEDYWYRVDISNNELISWITRQPTRLWYHVEHAFYGQSYVINEELYTLLQLTWGDK